MYENLKRTPLRNIGFVRTVRNLHAFLNATIYAWRKHYSTIKLNLLYTELEITEPIDGLHNSLFLTTFVALLLALARNHLSQHDNTVTIHESNSGQTLAILECIANKRLLRLETALSHLIRF